VVRKEGHAARRITDGRDGRTAASAVVPKIALPLKELRTLLGVFLASGALNSCLIGAMKKSRVRIYVHGKVSTDEQCVKKPCVVVHSRRLPPSSKEVLSFSFHSFLLVLRRRQPMTRRRRRRRLHPLRQRVVPCSRCRPAGSVDGPRSRNIKSSPARLHSRFRSIGPFLTLLWFCPPARPPAPEKKRKGRCGVREREREIE
jgi:hypothetical protein